MVKNPCLRIHFPIYPTNSTTLTDQALIHHVIGRVLLLNNIDHTYIVNVSNIYNTPQMKEHMKDMEDILYQLDGIYWDVWNTCWMLRRIH